MVMFKGVNTYAAQCNVPYWFNDLMYHLFWQRCFYPSFNVCFVNCLSLVEMINEGIQVISRYVSALICPLVDRAAMLLTELPRPHVCAWPCVKYNPGLGAEC